MAKLPALPFVRTGVTQGLSANQAYREYQAAAREIGFQGTRRQDFLRLYSQTRAIRHEAQWALSAEKATVPSAEHIIDRDTVNARGYGQWVAIYQRTTGQSDFMHMPFLVKTPQPITPEEAEQRALDFLAQQPDEYDRTTLGVAFLGTERFSPMPR